MPKSAAAKPPMPLVEHLELPVAQIEPSPANPRKVFNKEQLDDLAGDIRIRGVLQPILVRPAGIGKELRYELVFGERRFRAAKLAGLKTIPAMVRSLEDREVLEIALTENLKRADLHPLEEADGYRELQQKHGQDVDQIAEKIGKSKSYVYQRIKLCELGGDARKACFDGKLPASHGVLLARLPTPELQQKALRELLRVGAPSWQAERGVMSFEDAEDHIQAHYQVSLAGAPFNTKAEDLVAGVGACTTCPHRTGNQPDADPKRANVCTNPPCFSRKKAAALRIEKEKAKEKGLEVISAKIFDGWNNKIGYRNAHKYVELKDQCPEDPKGRTYKDLLGKEAPVVLARDAKEKLREVLRKEDVAEALKKAGHKFAEKVKKAAEPNAEKWKREQEESRKKSEAKARLIKQAVPKIIDAARANVVGSKELWRAIAWAVLGEAWNLYETPSRFDCNGAEELKKKIPSMDTGQLVALVFAAGFEQAQHAIIRGESELLEVAAAAFGVDLKNLEAKASSPADAVKGECRICHCTEKKACPGGCSWTDETETLCSKCDEELDV